MEFTQGYIVVYKRDGKPVERNGHFKVYATREAAQRRRYTCNVYSSATEVREIRFTVTG